MPKGLGMYVRHITTADHGTPKAFAKKCVDHGMKWMAIAGPWHDDKGQKMINKSDVAKRYMEALESKGIEAWVWGYPWQGTEDQFVDEMRACVPGGVTSRGLLDPELGSNPSRASSGAGKRAADKHAGVLVREMDLVSFHECGLSTYGSGVRMKWFPLYAFARALAKHYPNSSFVGGQTYTEDANVDPSIADFMKAIKKVTGEDVPETIKLVPNYGLYARKANGKARPKTVVELRAHLMEFINEGEPVEALIGWAENFATPELWNELAKFADLMERGACRL